jgi:hypothetical protein
MDACLDAMCAINRNETQKDLKERSRKAQKGLDSEGG